MNEPFYEFTILDEAHRFDFVSIGKAIIHKTVIYHNTSVPDFYSLVMGDIEDGEPDFYSVSNNGDMRFILSTIYQTLDYFLITRPEAVVAFTGSTKSRTRLYQIALCTNLERLQEKFRILGLTEGSTSPEMFVPGRSYQHFFICAKSLKFDHH